MSRRNRLTPAVVATVRDLRRRSKTYEQIAAVTGLSEGSIAKALKAEQTAPAAKRPRARATSAQDAPKGPPTREELAEVLRAHAGSLASEAERARAEGDHHTATTIGRQIVQTHALLERLVPAPLPAPALDELPDFRKLADEVRAKLGRMIDQVPLGPPCPTCGARSPIEVTS